MTTTPEPAASTRLLSLREAHDTLGLISADRLGRKVREGALHAHRAHDATGVAWRVPLVVAQAYAAGAGAEEQHRLCPLCTTRGVSFRRGGATKQCPPRADRARTSRARRLGRTLGPGGDDVA